MDEERLVIRQNLKGMRVNQVVSVEQFCAHKKLFESVHG
jgi:hypothetical protein